MALELWRHRGMGRTVPRACSHGAGDGRSGPGDFPRTGPGPGSPNAARAWAPAVDMIDRPDEVVVRADLPGLEQKDVDVTIQEGMLTIRGERKEEREEKKEGLDYYCSERAFGAFVRSMPLPPGVDPEKVKATFKNGVPRGPPPEEQGVEGQEDRDQGRVRRVDGEERPVSWPAMIKSTSAWGPTAPNLRDYVEARAFTWAAARRELDGLPGGRGLNIAHEAVDRHAAGPRAIPVAIRWIGKAARSRTSHTPSSAISPTASRTCLEPTRRGARAIGSSRWPAAFPELYVAALGTLKKGSVLPTVLGLRAGADPGAAWRSATPRSSSRRSRSTAERSRRSARPCRRCEHVLLVGPGEQSCADTRRLDDLTRRVAAGCERSRSSHRSRGPGPAALHVRHDGQAEGRGARARGGHRPLRHRQVRARPARRRHLLVHGRPRLGDRHVVRHVRAARPTA